MSTSFPSTDHEGPSPTDSAMPAAPLHLAIHGHFYQPPRQNPFTGLVDREPEAEPFHDYNERIWAECYLPNAEAGNFHLMSFDLGPTLAAWMRAAHPATLRLIANATRTAGAPAGNAMAQAYHHTILPLATEREKRLQIAWGVGAFRRTFGRLPAGMWLPEAAVDDATLGIMAELGVRYTVLAPWQAARGGEIDATEPYRVATGNGRDVAVFFYNSVLSGNVSFNDDATSDAGRFAASDLTAHINRAKQAAGRPQIVLVATDGELYGHHKRFRDLFLSHLLRVEAPAHGFEVTSPGAYLALYPPTQSMAVRDGTSWSCVHGVARWDAGCTCTGDAASTAWKRPLRAALRGLASRVDDLFEAETAALLSDPWTALEGYMDVHEGAMVSADYWPLHVWHGRALRPMEEQRLHGLMEMQVARQAMFVSCAWFFDDLDRIEPRIALAYAHRAVALAATHGAADLGPAFARDLAASVSARSGRSAADLYHEFAESVAGVA